MEIPTGTTIASVNASGASVDAAPSQLVIDDTMDTKQKADIKNDAVIQDQTHNPDDAAASAFDVGPSDIHLMFSKPAKVTVDVDLSLDGQSIGILVKHVTDDTFGTKGITMNPDATCTDGISDSENAIATVEHGQAVFYTCGASTFIISPTGTTPGTINNPFLSLANARSAVTATGTYFFNI